MINFLDKILTGLIRGLINFPPSISYAFNNNPLFVAWRAIEFDPMHEDVKADIMKFKQKRDLSDVMGDYLSDVIEHEMMDLRAEIKRLL